MTSTELAKQYENLKVGRAVSVLDNVFAIIVTGADRCKFLNSFCTADVVKAGSGETVEAFILDGKGKTIGHVFVLVEDQRLVLTGIGKQTQSLIEHLDRYIIREDVQLAGVSEAQIVGVFGTGQEIVSRATQTIREVDGVELISESFHQAEFAGEGLLMLACTEGKSAALIESLQTCDFQAYDKEPLEILRIESGTPWFGVDFDNSNLPQELCRDDKAISFEKGCYLGQETVARIDSLGRVNKLLCQVRLDNQPTEIDLAVDEKPIGKITSTTYSIEHDRWIGLAILKREYAEGKKTIPNAEVFSRSN